MNSKASVALVVTLGSLSKAVKMVKGPSEVKSSIKGTTPPAGHEERMKLAKMAARRMLPPESASAHADTPKVSQLGKEAGGKAPTVPKTGGVSGMASQSTDIFGIETYIVKPSELGSSTPEATSKNGKIRSVKRA